MLRQNMSCCKVLHVDYRRPAITKNINTPGLYYDKIEQLMQSEVLDCIIR